MNDIHVWNNAAFDDDGGGEFVPMKTSWSSSECIKENLSPPPLNYSPKKNTKTKGLSLGLGSDDKNIDDEIQAIEREITRLTTRLDALRLEKAKKRVAVGRIVPAKFMEPRPSGVVSRKLEETPKTKVKTNNNSWRRGMSLGPAEIAATPATAQSRRKSCFWKLPEIDEQPRAKTVGRVKKKEEAAAAASSVVVQPRKLFEKEKVKSVCESNGNGKKGLLKQGRVVASRYNSDVRKRSLPEGGSEVRVKKRWEIPKTGEQEQVVAATTTIMLPKIKTVKCVNESPRDSGAAKRVAELVGKKPFFSTEDKDVCQILNFAEDESQ